jgi:hypothetical protein
LIVLDTNAFSEAFRPAPDPRATATLRTWPLTEVFLTAVTVAEVRVGIARMPAGRRQLTLFDATEGILADSFVGRVLPFDLNSAAYYADLVADRFAAGRPISVADGQIAAICRQHGATLVTRNVRDFEGMGLDLIDPWAD